MYKSEYYKEDNSEINDSYTSAALTVGVIVTVICFILMGLRCITVAVGI